MAVFRYKMQGILDIKEKLEDKAKQNGSPANGRIYQGTAKGSQ